MSRAIALLVRALRARLLDGRILLLGRQRLEPRRVYIAFPHTHVLAYTNLDTLVRERTRQVRRLCSLCDVEDCQR